jgi:hypothetical protein
MTEKISSGIVNNVPALPAGRWNYAHVLLDDGIGYGDYVEAVPAHPCASRLPVGTPF